MSRSTNVKLESLLSSVEFTLGNGKLIDLQYHWDLGDNTFVLNESNAFEGREVMRLLPLLEKVTGSLSYERALVVGYFTYLERSIYETECDEACRDEEYPYHSDDYLNEQDLEHLNTFKATVGVFD